MQNWEYFWEKLKLPFIPGKPNKPNKTNLRELLATSVILGMCAGRWGRNGSSRRRIISPTFGVDEIVR